MTVLKNQLEFGCPASILPKGYSAIGAVGSAELEEAVMRILWFSRVHRVYVSVSRDDLERQWNDPRDGASLMKAIGGLTRLYHSIKALVDSDTLLELENGEYAPTPKLVSAVMQSKSKMIHDQNAMGVN